MLYTKCTVHDGDGGRCGVTDVCALVRTYDRDPTIDDAELLHEHRVCFDHRQQMGLPEQDVALYPLGMRELVDA